MARAQETPTHSHPLHEVLSLVYLGIGTLLYLALISYSPSDVPSWFPLSSLASARGPVLNFVGRTGAIVACSSYAFRGAASYLLAALFRYGRHEEALAYVRRHWGMMLDAGATTWWEEYHGQTSRCHAWSIGPTIDLMAQFLGIGPAAPGFTPIGER